MPFAENHLSCHAGLDPASSDLIFRIQEIDATAKSAFRRKRTQFCISNYLVRSSMRQLKSAHWHQTHRSLRSGGLPIKEKARKVSKNDETNPILHFKLSMVIIRTTVKTGFRRRSQFLDLWSTLRQLKLPSGCAGAPLTAAAGFDFVGNDIYTDFSVDDDMITVMKNIRNGADLTGAAGTAADIGAENRLQRKEMFDTQEKFKIVGGRFETAEGVNVKHKNIAYKSPLHKTKQKRIGPDSGPAGMLDKAVMLEMVLRIENHPHQFCDIGARHN
jgi:hypothetical protein